jgi:hypothetical protein
MHMPSFGAFAQAPVQPAPRRNCALDATATRIVTAAQGAGRLDARAVAAVRSILNTYFRAQAGKVQSIRYREGEPGLLTTRVGTGPGAQGIITVGKYFIEHTTPSGFARRVMQLGHELKHIDQYRAGMIGAARRHEREFLAFCWGALAPERPGTGCVSHSTRVNLIDAALRHWNCLSAATRAKYPRHHAALLRERPVHQRASGRPATPVPTQCAG